MISKLLALIGLGGPEHDGKVLASDAVALIDMLHGQHSAVNLAKIAGMARQQIDEVHRRGLDDPQYYKRGVTHLTELNRAARSRRDNIAWSGITLAIIYIKAEMLGEYGASAMNAIGGYFEKWEHVYQADSPETET